MVAAAHFDDEVTQGNDYSLTVTFVDDNGAALDVSNQTFTGAVREVDNGPVLAEHDINDTGAATGVVVFTIPGADTDDFPERTVYDLWMTDSEAFTFMRGDLIVPRRRWVGP